MTQEVEQRLALEKRKKPLQDASVWQSFFAQDPLVSLIGAFEDEASDVSRNKSDYLADTHRPGTGSLRTWSGRNFAEFHIHPLNPKVSH